MARIAETLRKDMKNITVEEIMDTIDSTSVEMYNSEWHELTVAITKLIESKKVSDMKTN